MVGLGTGHSEPFFHFDSKLVLFDRVRRDFDKFFYLRQNERKTKRSQENVKIAEPHYLVVKWIETGFESL